jgi:hypothetical protein
MMDESGSGSFYLIVLVLLIVLGATIAYAMLRRGPRDPTGRIKRAADEATKRNFDKER